METAKLILDQHYKITAEHINFYKENGYIKLKQVLSPAVVEYYGDVITDKVKELSKYYTPLKERDTYGKAFLQIGNLWEKDEKVKDFAFSKTLAQIATELMEVEGVRMYHDQALYKEASGGYTPWHVDQAYWPLQGDKTITAWIPLQSTPKEMGPLCFAAKSHHFQEYRNILISDESEKLIQEAMVKERYEYVEEAFDVGEVSFHTGWTYHRAGPNQSVNSPRRVMTVIYMDKDILINDDVAEDDDDHKIWLNAKQPGSIADGPLNPILYELK